MENRNIEEIKRKYRRQAAFSQAKWVTHIALRTGHFWVSCFSVNITHCWILRWSGVSGWSSGSISDSTSLINVVLTPKPPPSTAWKHVLCLFVFFFVSFFFCFVVFLLLFFFSVASTSKFAEKAEKRHMPLSGTLETNHLNKRSVRMRSKYMIVCMLSCNGTDVWVCMGRKKGPGVGTVSGLRGSQSHQLTSSGGTDHWLIGRAVRRVTCVCLCPWLWVRPVYSVKVRDMTVSEKCAGNVILSSWSGYNPWQAAPVTSHMSYSPT